MLDRLFANATPAHAHCDLYCGVYDPAQAKIEALSCLKTLQKYHDSDDDHFRPARSSSRSSAPRRSSIT